MRRESIYAKTGVDAFLFLLRNMVGSFLRVCSDTIRTKYGGVGAL